MAGKIFSRTSLVLALALSSAAPIALSPALAQARGDAAYIERGISYMENNQLDEAVIELKNAVKANPKNAQARFLLGKAYFTMGDIVPAQRNLERAVELKPNDEADILLAEISLRADNAAEAIKIISRPASTQEMQVQKYAVAAAAYISLNKLEKARESYNNILKIDPRRIEAHYGLARVDSSEGNHRSALDRARNLTNARPDYAPAWMLLGEIFLAQDAAAEADDAFTTAIRLAPNDPNPLISRARARLAAGHLNAARSDAEALEKLVGEVPITHYIRSAIYFSEGNIDEANYSFTQLQRAFDGFPPAILLGSLIKNARGELAQANTLLQRYIMTDPNNLDARRALAAIRLRMGQPTSGIDILKEVLEEAPNDTASLRILARSQIAMGKPEEARRSYQRIIRINSNERDTAYATMALSMLNPNAKPADTEMENVEVRIQILQASDALESGDIETAEIAIARLEQIAPKAARLSALQAALASAKGDEGAARGFLNEALRRDPELNSALQAAASLDRSQGNTAAIVKRLQGLLEKNTSSEELTIRLATALTEDGRNGEAANLLASQARRMPRSVPVSRSLVSSLLDVKQNEAAANETRRLVTLSNVGPDTLAFAANVMMRTGHADEAVAIASRLKDMIPDRAESYILEARALAEANRYQDAQNTLRTAAKRWKDARGIVAAQIELAADKRDTKTIQAAADRHARQDPIDAEIMRSRALIEAGQSGEAVSVLERVFNRNPDGKLAVALFAAKRLSGNDNNAFAGIQQWLNTHPDDQIALMAYATGLMETGKLKEAERIYDRLLTIEPDNPVALNNYAWLRHKSGHTDAIDFAHKAFKIAGGAPEIADTYGWMLVQAGETDKALPILARASRSASDNPEIGYHFAYALLQAGKTDDARRELTIVLDGSVSFDGRQEAERLFAQIQ